MGSNRSGRRRTQRLNRHRKEMARLYKKALAQSGEQTTAAQQGSASAHAEANKG